MKPGPPLYPPASERLRHRFAPHVRERGLRYYQQGAVRITNADASGVTASVMGSRRYLVALRFNKDALGVLCSCPAFDSGPCKHAWATILRAEELGHLDSFRSGRPPQRVPDPEVLPEPEEDDDLDDIDLDDLAAEFDPDFDPEGQALEDRWRRPGGFVPGRPALARTESWRERLERAAMFGGGLDAPRAPMGQIVYVVDVPATLASAGLTVEVARRRPSKTGAWGEPMALRLPVGGAPHDAVDRELLALLRGSQLDSPHGSYSYGYGIATQFRLPGGAAELLVPRLCATGRCLLRRDAAAPVSELAWDPGEPWELWLEMRLDGQHCVLEGELRRGSERRPLREPHLIVDPLVFFGDVAARFDHAKALPLAWDLRRHGALKVPRAHAEQALALLLLRPERPRLVLDPALAFEEVQSPPVPHLVLKPSQHRWTDRLQCTLSFDYGDTRVLPAVNPNWCVAKLAERRLVVRDRALEGAAVGRLDALGFRWIGGGRPLQGNLELAPRHLPRAVRALLSEGWRVEAEGKLYRSAGAVRMEVVSGIDWFDVKGAVDFDDTSVPLPKVLAALRRGETTVALGDGSLGLLPEEWLKRYGLLSSLGSPEPDALRFRRSQAGLLDALLAAQPDAALDDAFIQARQALRDFDGIRPAAQPKGFAGQLREYQREGLGWLNFLQRFGFGGCLADDMGLGKTIQVLALLEAHRSPAQGDKRPSLIVVPRSLVFNWKDEAARFVPRLRILDHAGAERAKEARAFAGFDVVLTTYGTLRRDVLLLKDVEFEYVVLDEAQAVKNAATESAKAVRLLKARHRLALSGTPIENHIGELWSLFEFLNPGLLGKAEPFRKRAGSGLDEAELGVLARALRPFILRRTKGEVARDLPPKVEQTVHCELDKAQRKLYDELRRHYRGSLLSRIEREGIARSKIHVLEALLRLRQAACHPGLIDPQRKSEPSAKLDELLTRLDEVREEGHKALVFSQFTSFLAILRQRLDERRLAYEYLDGRTRDRAERVRRFQEQAGAGLFLISLKAGGLGLNLTAAEYVFLLDPWWNPAVEAQAIDRSHRIGQSRHVFAYRLIAKETVEEKVLELQERKRGLADALLGGDKSLIGELRREDVELLLS